MNRFFGRTVPVILCAVALAGCMTEQEQHERLARKWTACLQTHRETIVKSARQRVEQYWSDLAEHNYNFIQAQYAARDGGRSEYEGVLSTWLEPRLKLTQDEKMQGEALLEGFASRYMPNAAGVFEKAKESAMEIQQMFNENFPKPWTIKPDSPNWTAYCKLLRGFCKVRARYFRIHDELCHYYVLRKVGAVSAEDLAKIDQANTPILLLEENRNDISFPLRKHEALDAKTSEFGAKYAPEAYAVYSKLKNERDESLRLHAEVVKEARLIDAVRFNLGLIALCEKINYITLTMDKIGSNIRTLHVDHKTLDKDAEAIAKIDHSIAMRWKRFVTLLTDYVGIRANGPLIPVNSAMNEFYPNYELERWHWWALGFPTSSRGRGWDGFEKRFNDFYYGPIKTGDVLDSLSMANCITDDHVAMSSYFNRDSESAREKKIVYERVDGVEHDGHKVSFSYRPFSLSAERYRHHSSDEDGQIKLRSATRGIVTTSIGAIMNRVVKRPWNEWSGSGEPIPFETPFEIRLNDFNGGACMCEVRVVHGKKRDRYGDGMDWWKAVEVK